MLHTVHPTTGDYFYQWERIPKPRAPLPKRGAATSAASSTGGAAGATSLPASSRYSGRFGGDRGGSAEGGAGGGPGAIIETVGHWPSPRSGHAVELVGPLMLVFGGRHRSGRFNDVEVRSGGMRIFILLILYIIANYSPRCYSISDASISL